MTVVAVAMTSCVKSDVVLPRDESALPEIESYAVPVDEALQALTNELRMIDGNGTRAGGPRTVKSVKSVKYEDMALKTRSGEAPEGIEDLIYVVEFEDGQGSAVLGADKRVEPVIAVLDETVLTTEDFTNPSEDDSDIKTYVTSLIANSVTNEASTKGKLPDMEPIATMSFFEYDTVDVVKIEPITKTKWAQSLPPYNSRCFVNGQQAHAGCAPIAVGQVLMSNKYPSNTISIRGYNFSWSQLSKYEYGQTGATPADFNAVANFIYQIGQAMEIQYGSGFNPSSVPISQYASFFRNCGYQSVELIDFDYNEAKQLLRRNMVFVARGDDASGSSGGVGHAWVIDGMHSYAVTYNEIWKDTTVIPYREVSRTVLSEVSHDFWHCNYGEGGKCDGYYWHGIFNTNVPLASEYIDTSVGDYAGVHTGNYSTNIKMVTYSLN